MSAIHKHIQWLEQQNTLSIKNERVYDSYTAGLKDAWEGCLSHARALLAEEKANDTADKPKWPKEMQDRINKAEYLARTGIMACEKVGKTCSVCPTEICTTRTYAYMLPKANDTAGLVEELGQVG